MSASKKSSLERYRLEQTLRELDAKKGRHTELVTVYVPPEKQISDVIGYLQHENTTAANIKSKQTRKNVQDALTTIVQRLKLFKQPPPNGLVAFCGAIPQNGEGSEKIELYVIEPVERVNTFLYWCDASFHTDILRDMITEKDTYGIIVLDRSEATFALLQGNGLKIVEHITSGVPGKHDAGGQSANRFRRIIEQLAHEFYVRIGEYATKIFLDPRIQLTGLLIGGPGPTKQEFANGEYLQYQLREKVIATVDIGYTGEEGVRELVERSRKNLKEVRYVREKRLIQFFLKNLATDTDTISYGYRDVMQKLAAGAVKTLIISEKLDTYHVYYICKNDQTRKDEIVSGDRYRQMRASGETVKCDLDGNYMEIEKATSLIEDFAKLADQTKTRIEIVSAETEEGDQLLRSFGGVGAILRYKVAAT